MSVACDDTYGTKTWSLTVGVLDGSKSHSDQ